MSATNPARPFINDIDGSPDSIDAVDRWPHENSDRLGDVTMPDEPPSADEAVAETLVPSAAPTFDAPAPLDGRTLADPSADEPDEPDEPDMPVMPDMPANILAGLEGRRVGRFRLLAKLGEGGMGVVVEALDEHLDRKVALKFLTRARDDEVARERLAREARSLARLSHPNIVAVYDSGVSEGLHYLAMELVEGRTLRRWLDGDDAAPPPGRVEILEMFLAIGRALAAAHELGVVHRDFKPDNVLIGDDGRPRIVDFGLASIGQAAVLGPAVDPDALDHHGASLTRTGAVMGTPAYMAPEQWHGRPADARSDQFGYCVALFEALYRRSPFAGESMAALMAAVIEGEPVAIPVGERVPDALHQAILRGLAREPAQRWDSLAILLAQIEAALAKVQPGLFTAAPTPILGFAVPILYLVPLTWLSLERLGVVEYAARSWFWLSTIQVLLMTSGAVALRRRLVEFLGDRRMLIGPAFMAMFVLGHRIIAAATHSSIELMFAYDFLALTGLIAAIVHFADRSLWPALGLPTGLLTLALIEPEWAPRLWAAFTIGMPPTIAVVVLRSRDRLRGGLTRSGSGASGHSSRSRSR